MTKTLLRPEDVFVEYGIPLSTQSKRRMSGNFAPFIKNGRAVLYRRHELEAWLDRNTCKSTLDAQRAA